MKKITLISMALSLGIASFSVNAKKPHPDSLYPGLNVSCTCDWSADPGACTVSWTNVGAPAYGASVVLEAEWTTDGVDMSSSAALDLDDNWVCNSLMGTCSASGEFVLPDYPDDAVLTFDGKIKGFDNGPDGVTSRDFIKETGKCNLPVDGALL